MNQVPEIVCDLLFYLSGYIHHRTDEIPKDVYTKMLKAQILNVPVATQEQIDNYNSEGWKHDAVGIDRNLEALIDFSNNFKRLRDAKPTAEESLKADMRMFQILKANNIPIGMQLQSVNDNFNNFIKNTVAIKGVNTAVKKE